MAPRPQSPEKALTVLFVGLIVVWFASFPAIGTAIP